MFIRVGGPFGLVASVPAFDAIEEFPEGAVVSVGFGVGVGVCTGTGTDNTTGTPPATRASRPLPDVSCAASAYARHSAVVVRVP